jgi:hypothetical protein
VFFENPGAVAAHQNRGNGERDATLLEHVKHRRLLENANQSFSQYCVTVADVASSNEHAPDCAERAFDPVSENLATMFAVEVYDLAHRATNRERARDHRARARSRDQIEPFAEIESCHATRACELRDETIKERGSVNTAHAAPI